MEIIIIILAIFAVCILFYIVFGHSLENEDDVNKALNYDDAFMAKMQKTRDELYEQAKIKATNDMLEDLDRYLPQPLTIRWKWCAKTEVFCTSNCKKCD